ncbi:GntR family transcriptional regulator [Aquirufa sp. ROCK2-A2]
MIKSFNSLNVKSPDNKLPKYQQLIKSLLQDIEMGDLKPGERLPSINEASEECYLSRDTVERAYTELHKMGVITSIFRKGYFISDSTLHVKSKILFLVGKITESNTQIFNSLTEIIGKNATIDIFAYQYKTKNFKEIINQQLGNYHYYVITPHMIEEDEETTKALKKIAGDRLILIDSTFKNLQNNHSSIVYKNKSELQKILLPQLNLFKKYSGFNLVLSEVDYFDANLITACREFCESITMEFQVLDGLDEDDFRCGELYFTLQDEDLVQAIKYAEKNQFEIGKDVGLIAFNDSPLKEILNGGISVLSNQSNKIGEMVASIILDNAKTHQEINLEFIIRKSL